jgi:hypothetical protein
MLRSKVAIRLQTALKELGIEKAALHAFRHMASLEQLEGGTARFRASLVIKNVASRRALDNVEPKIGRGLAPY